MQKFPVCTRLAGRSFAIVPFAEEGQGVGACRWLLRYGPWTAAARREQEEAYPLCECMSAVVVWMLVHSTTRSN